MEISGYIGKFFDAHEQVKTAAAEQKKNPPKGKSLKSQALDNIFQEMELERQAVELRELLIYGVDPALGAVWTRFQEEFERLQAEQEKALIAFLSLVIVFAILLPIMAMMYLDILETKAETKRQQAIVQRLINKAEENK